MHITIGEPASDLPAWIQAVGSVLAILIAIYIPYAQRQSESRKGADNKKHLAEFITGHIDLVLGHQKNDLRNFIEQFSMSFKVDHAIAPSRWLSYAEESLARANAQVLELERFKSLPISEWPSFEAASRYFELCYENRDWMEMISKNWQLEKVGPLERALRENLDGYGQFMEDGSNGVKDAFRRAGLMAGESLKAGVADED